jgi:hypothetical protein
MSKPIVMERGVKYRDADKMALIPVKNVATEARGAVKKTGMDENQTSGRLFAYPGDQSGDAQKWPSLCL